MAEVRISFLACCTLNVFIAIVGLEFERFDGWYNNKANHAWGTPGSHLLRKMDAVYADGVYTYPEGRPNERLISWKAMSGPSGLPSYMNRTAFLALFGQFVSLESLKAGTGCPRELTPIAIPECDPDFDAGCTGKKKVPFIRAKYDTKTGQGPGSPREQLNLASSYIDGSVIYSNSKVWVDTLRSFKDGRLKSRDEEGLWPVLNDAYMNMLNPPPSREHKLMAPERQWLLGDPRVFQHPATLAFGLIFFRYHNFLAKKFKLEHPDWDDEQLFYHVRKWIIAIQQKIYVYDFFPAFTNDTLDAYKGYNSHLHPGVSSLFQAAAFRFGHSMVSPGLYRRDGQCNFLNTTDKTVSSGQYAVKLCNTWFHGDEAFEFGLDPILMGLASQIAEREDHILDYVVRGKLFGPIQHSRRDLLSVNIKRGRDNGLPDYNTCRQAMGLQAVSNWTDINPWLFAREPEVINTVAEVYEYKLENLDVFVGGLLESLPSGPGPLFRVTIKDQFTRFRDGDRYWYENELNGLFTSDEINYIKTVRLYDIILNVTNITAGQIQEDVFFFHDGDPCPQPKQVNGSELEDCNENQGQDFFSGSEAIFLTIILSVGIFPFVCIVAAEVLSRIHLRGSSNIPEDDDINSLENPFGHLVAVEWRGPNESRRIVQPQLRQNEGVLKVLDKSGVEMKTIDFVKIGEVVTVISSDYQNTYLLVRDHKEYDLVMKFVDGTTRQKFSDCLAKIATDRKLKYEEAQQPLKQICSNAETKEKRKMKVEMFLKDVFEQIVNNEKKDKKSNKPAANNKMKSVLGTEMSRAEFAESLALEPDCLFVEQMFAMVDKDGNGYVSFREFLDLLVLLSKGSEEDKMRMMFDMYDLDGSGSMDKEEFTTMIRSMVEMANNNLEQDEIHVLLDSMFSVSGLQDKEELTFDDFVTLMRQENQTKDAKKDGVILRESSFVSLTSTADAVQKRAASARSVRQSLSGQKTNNPEEEQNTKKQALKIHAKEETHTSGLQKKVKSFMKFMANNRLKLFYLIAFYSITIAAFVERAYYYSVEREHVGLRRMTGYGVTVTRGFASAMSFTYSVALLTMCRNTLNFLRKTWIGNWVPVDSALEFHKIVSWTSVAITFGHVVGHGINFYHLSTQPPDYVECVFKSQVTFRTDYLPSFGTYIFQTVTGFSGYSLVLVLTLMSIFATGWARRKIYNAFWTIHNLYIVLYALIIVHGSASLVQDPWFHYFFLGPAFLFTCDKLMSMKHNAMPFEVIKVEHLPSNVTHIVLKKPQTFSHVAGQWCRIASAAFNENEYHPFTITAAPHEDFISFHCRALGPWTWTLREHMDPYRNSWLPMYVDGPFGGVSEDWHKYDMALFVGGGIGITPYAAILKHIIHQRSLITKFFCKKVYFFWVCQNQNQFEWMIDICKDVEEADVENYIETHLFVTQFFGKYDLRTVMMYMCEKQFVNLSEKSMFTGLRAATHFGRPNFIQVFTAASNAHPELKKIGVFGCGPVPLTQDVGKACAELNTTSAASFDYFSENFG